MCSSDLGKPQESLEQSVRVNSVGDYEHPSHEVKINEVDIEMKFDSCSQLTILSAEEYSRSFRYVPLHPLDINPGGYGGQPIKMLGYFEAILAVGGKSTTGKVYVSEKGDNLISWPHQKTLGIKLDPNAFPQVQIKEVEVSENTYVRKFQSLFRNDLGCLKGYEHKIRLKNNCTPKVAKVRRIPMCLHEQVEKELNNLLDQNIIEEIQASEWLAPMVVSKKSNGEVCLCVYLRELNKEVIVDRFPLPNID